MRARARCWLILGFERHCLRARTRETIWKVRLEGLAVLVVGVVGDDAQVAGIARLADVVILDSFEHSASGLVSVGAVVKTASVGNAENPSVIVFFRRISDGQKSVGKMGVGNPERRKI